MEINLYFWLKLGDATSLALMLHNVLFFFFNLHPEHNVVFKKMLTQWIGGLAIVFLTSPFINSLGIKWHYVKRRVGFLTRTILGRLRFIVRCTDYLHLS